MIITTKVKKFDEYIKNKTGSYISEFLNGATEKQKQNIFLKWKVGLEDPSANYEIDSADKDIIAQLDDRSLQGMKGERLDYFIKKILFENQSNKWRSILGFAECFIPGLGFALKRKEI